MKCIHPTVISDGKGSRRLVPCGRCAWCRKKKRDEWFVRFLAESMKHPCYFLTLTYSDDFIPCRYVDKLDGETFIIRGIHSDIHNDPDYIFIGSVPYIKDWQDYMKRVRKCLSSNVRYFFVSEYGKQFGRIHYHALIWCDDEFCAKVFADKWPFGDAVCENAGIGSMKYITKYILKGSDHKSNGLRDDNIKSNSAGIGSDLWPKLIKHYIDSDYQCTFQWFGSYHSFPNYYKKKIREYLDNNSDSVEIQIVSNNNLELVVKNRHCDFVQKLDIDRSLPTINDEDLIHQLMRLKVTDLPLYIQELYQRDLGKQYEINSKINPFLNV